MPVWEFDDAKAPEQLENARFAANRAIALNPTSGRARAVLGYAHMLLLNWRETFFNFELAAKYEPENATVWHWYSTALSTAGQFDEGGEAIKKALELDPRSRIIGTSSADEFIRTGQYDAALDAVDKTLTFAPDFAFAWQIKGLVHILRNEYSEARLAFQKAPELGDNQLKIGLVDYVEESVRGQPVPVPAWIYNPDAIDQYAASMILVCAGRYEDALDLIEQQSNSNIPHLAAYYLRSALYKEKMGHIPRYQELVKRLATFERGGS